MKEDYSCFYLSMLGGIAFMAGMFYSMEFGMFTLRWFISLILHVCSLIISAMFLSEKGVSPKDFDEVKYE